MCSRREVREAQEAQDRAADALAGLCVKGLCSDDLGKALQDFYAETLNEPVPDDLAELVRGLK